MPDHERRANLLHRPIAHVIIGCLCMRAYRQLRFIVSDVFYGPQLDIEVLAIIHIISEVMCSTAFIYMHA